MRIMLFLLFAINGSRTSVTHSENNIVARPKLPVSS